MAQIDGKQIKNATIAATKVDSTIIVAAGTNPFTGNQSLGNNRITSLGAPTADTDAARKQDVDAVAAGLAWKDAAKLGTDAALPAVTYANGTAGVGATLTADAVGVLTIDSVATVLNDRLLIKNQVAGLQNGIYDVTTEGTGGVAFILTRATDADVSAELDSATLPVQQGTVNADTRWTQTVDTPTIGTTALSFTNIGGLGEVTAGAGLTKTVNTLDVGQNATGAIKVNADDIEVITDDVTIEDDASASPAKLRVKDAGIDENKLNTSVAGNGITGGGGTALAVQADGDSVAVGASGIKAATPTTSNKDMTANATSSDGDQATATTIAAAPAGLSGRAYVQVFVNGIKVLVGDATKTSVDGYFSGDAGSTARAFDAIVSGDTFHWNGSVAGYELATTDRLDFDYTVA